MEDPRLPADHDQLPEPAFGAGDRPRGLGPRRRFLSVWYQCCHVYGRMYRNPEATAYEGRCPKCGGAVHALIGPDGSNRRMFLAD